MRFIHTADWHLGKLFGQRYMTEDQAFVLDALVEAVRTYAADAVVIAGDVYDRSVPPAEAVALFGSVLGKIRAAGAEVLFISGNHDSGRRLDFGAEVLAMAGVHVRARLTDDLSPVVIGSAEGPVAFSLIPYLDPIEVRDVFGIRETLSFDEAAALVVEKARAALPGGMPSVAVAHAFLAGGVRTESVRALSVGGSDQISPAHFKDFSYAALGHLHGPQRAGAETIRYAGSPLCYSFDEVRQEKGFELVSIDAAGAVSHAFHALAPRHAVRVVEGMLDDLRAGSDPLPRDDYVLVRLLDTVRPLSAREKLAERYDNIFGIEFPNFKAQAIRSEAHTANEGASDMEKFADFYREATGEAMTEEQRAFFIECVDAMDREARAEKDAREAPEGRASE